MSIVAKIPALRINPRNQERLDAYRAKLAERDIAAYARLLLSRHGELVWLDGKELPIFLRKQAS